MKTSPAFMEGCRAYAQSVIGHQAFMSSGIFSATPGLSKLRTKDRRVPQPFCGAGHHYASKELMR